MGDLDTLGEITGGGGYPNLIAHTVKMELYGHQVDVLDLDTLIRVKRAAGRQKDFDAISELEAIKAMREE